MTWPFAKKRDHATPLKLHSTRLMHLSSSYAALLSLFDRESTRTGDDPAGIPSFISAAFEHAEAMVYDVNVLAPFPRLELYDRLAFLKQRAERIAEGRFVALEGPRIIGIDSPLAQDPNRVGGAAAMVVELVKSLDLPPPFELFITYAGWNAIAENSGFRQKPTGVKEAENLRVPPGMEQELISMASPDDEHGSRSQRQWDMALCVRTEDADPTFQGFCARVSGIEFHDILPAFAAATAGMKDKLEQQGLPPDLSRLHLSAALVPARKKTWGVIHTCDPEDPLRPDMRIVPEGRDDAQMKLLRHAPVIEIKDSAAKLGLSPGLARKLLATAARVETYFRRPLTIEWSLDRTGEPVITQVGPLSLPPGFAPKEDESGPPEDEPELLLEGRGHVVCRGVAAGPVWRPDQGEEPAHCPAGVVLVTTELLAELSHLQAARRAAAIVTERGTPTGHMASLVRQFRVPAIFGAEGACRKLAPGRTVTVDADENAVYDGRVERLISRRSIMRIRTGKMPGQGPRAQLLKAMAPLTGLMEGTSDRPGTLHDLAFSALESAADVTAERIERASHAVTLECPAPLAAGVIDLGGALGAGGLGMEDVQCEPLRLFLEGAAGLRPEAGVLDELAESEDRRAAFAVTAAATGEWMVAAVSCGNSPASAPGADDEGGGCRALVLARTGVTPEYNRVFCRVMAGRGGTCEQRSSGCMAVQALFRRLDMRLGRSGRSVSGLAWDISRQRAERRLKALGRFFWWLSIKGMEGGGGKTGKELREFLAAL